MVNLRYNSSQVIKTKQEFEVSLNQLNIDQSEKSNSALHIKRLNKIKKRCK